MDGGSWLVPGVEGNDHFAKGRGGEDIRDDLPVRVVLVECLADGANVGEDGGRLEEIVQGRRKTIKDRLGHFGLVRNERL